MDQGWKGGGEYTRPIQAHSHTITFIVHCSYYYYVVMYEIIIQLTMMQYLQLLPRASVTASAPPQIRHWPLTRSTQASWIPHNAVDERVCAPVRTQ